MLDVADDHEQGRLCLPDPHRLRRGANGRHDQRHDEAVPARVRRLPHVLGGRGDMPDVTRLALIGGIYSNYHALVATLDDVRRRGSEATYFLGDLGAFGPYPDRVPELLIERGIA